MSLVEIGPRFVLQVMRIFDGSFCGSTLYKNGEFVSPNMVKKKKIIIFLFYVFYKYSFKFIIYNF